MFHSSEPSRDPKRKKDTTRDAIDLHHGIFDTFIGIVRPGCVAFGDRRRATRDAIDLHHKPKHKLVDTFIGIVRSGCVAFGLEYTQKDKSHK